MDSQETSPTGTPQRPWFGLALGALPALAVGIGMWLDASWTTGILQRWDFLVAWGALLVFLLGQRLWTANPFAGSGYRWAMLAAPVPALLAMLTLGGPITNDEYAYIYQAELLASGSMTEALPAAAADGSSLLEVFRRRQLYEDPEQGVRFAKYAPGSSLALTPFAALGLPPLVTTLLLALLNLRLLYCLAKRLDLGPSAIAAVLYATSPFFLLVHSSVQSEVFTTPAVLGLALVLLRARQQEGGMAWSHGVWIGALSGWVFLVRPLTGVLVALAAALVVLAWTKSWSLKLRTLGLATLGGLPFLAFLLWWNQQLTGDWGTNVYELYAQKYGPFDPKLLPERVPIDVYGKGDFLQGLLRQSARWGVALGGMLGAIGLGFWGCWQLRKRDGGFAFAVALLIPLAYAWHWYPGHRAYLGPLYAFESCGLLLLGLLAFAKRMPQRQGNALLLACLACGGAVFAVRWPLIADEAQARSMPQRVAAEAPEGAVIFLPPKREGRKELAFKYWTPSLPADLQDPTARVVLRTSGRFPAPRLVQEFGLQDRPLFYLRPDPEDSRQGSLEAFALPR